jgi:hypothetical protein
VPRGFPKHGENNWVKETKIKDEQNRLGKDDMRSTERLGHVNHKEHDD